MGSEKKADFVAVAVAPAGRKANPHDSDFKQQRFRHWKPRFTTSTVVKVYVLLGLVCILLGSLFLVMSNALHQVEVRYDDNATCGPLDASGSKGQQCWSEIVVDEDMSAPVFMYFKLTNFFQNHRRYVKSRSDAQLRAESFNDQNCAPLIRYGDAFGTPDPALVGKLLYPCGLIANSFFTDVFEDSPCLYRASDPNNCVALTGDNWRKDGIAWASDRSGRFKYQAPGPDETRQSPLGFEMPRVDNEELMVWMRVASTNSFTKLHRRILDTDLKAGDRINFTITANFPASSFEGSKSIVLATVGSMGGQDTFTGVAFLTIGIICLLLAGAFWYRQYEDANAIQSSFTTLYSASMRKQQGK